MPWDELLAPFRSEERAEVVSVLLDRRDMMHACATWPTVPRAGGPPKRARAWSDLWTGIDVDFQSWAAQTGLPEGAIYRLFRGLRDARVIYPDGSAHSLALKAIRVMLSKRLS